MDPIVFSALDTEFHATTVGPRLPPPTLINGRIVFQKRFDRVRALEALDDPDYKTTKGQHNQC